MDPGSLAPVANSATGLRLPQTKEKKKTTKIGSKMTRKRKKNKQKKTRRTQSKTKSKTGGPFMVKFKLPPLTIPTQLKVKKSKYDTKTKKVFAGSLVRLWEIVRREVEPCRTIHKLLSKKKLKSIRVPEAEKGKQLQEKHYVWIKEPKLALVFYE